MSTAREIHTKIGSVNSTQKITRAMQLVAASKMRKAQERMNTSRPYAQKIHRVIRHVASSHAEYRHPYMLRREQVERVGFIIISTDRGLCGGLNINLFRKVILEMKHWNDQKVGVDICVIGRKAQGFFSRHGAHISGAATHLGDTPALEDVVGVAQTLLRSYDQERCDRIYICANEFINAMTQKPFIRELLPLQHDEDATLDHVRWDYLYEPDAAKKLLTMLLVRYIESQVYQAVIENIACEQAARMVAMQNATDNAKDIIKELQLAYNNARQAGITREIAEIVSGAEALR
ncbi:MAG: F0F1 ATP synthase subunit gamma [Gammaproteobacteria bacterium RIFCSPLOWO2_02_FULL_42_14]|nr:MAG: F0F1 ATP synthase subunit gamma [Gammaproteobacteria bacterium RIFCSPHIGHO2_02_FULL_42_43]OGT28839.1 MAG: F0F1 ATP synthase subunit gamma [Gammaproteobacteria bacterium RIFCSPHIGHO2_01_FULL_42_8]OGT51509.1 MAG: F0F1 ATP synthase subunit gamma [Gammaproteobacteria bacterium RIFCSPHIGHO2_12_FULL_41_25]OGT62210.1 MAG: F0F1 ATP synthase subunit gamma [Gammaproteobacteria bacterium RIFCSPLOWO2_02_FULL_42_14]OGT85883.1 MAG: F0F1 ATP synthase subunit gamma [Gammaproteobacteria bacterium RIFCSP